MTETRGYPESTEKKFCSAGEVVNAEGCQTSKKKARRSTHSPQRNDVASYIQTPQYVRIEWSAWPLSNTVGVRSLSADPSDPGQSHDSPSTRMSGRNSRVNVTAHKGQTETPWSGRRRRYWNKDLGHNTGHGVKGVEFDMNTE